jgi:hypothetical protein
VLPQQLSQITEIASTLLTAGPQLVPAGEDLPELLVVEVLLVELILVQPQLFLPQPPQLLLQQLHFPFPVEDCAGLPTPEGSRLTLAVALCTAFSVSTETQRLGRSIEPACFSSVVLDQEEALGDFLGNGSPASGLEDSLMGVIGLMVLLIEVEQLFVLVTALLAGRPALDVLLQLLPASVGVGSN